ncbi:MAG: hypothetical protein ISS26_00085 [Candidatus Omnitrophica bacterium]|nr:hypothetical protein [Candidatus Omnitrophota bacterium]
MQQQLNAIEKKLDNLISQSSSRPFEKSYSQKPARHFDHVPRHDRGREGNRDGERTLTRVICSGCNKECEIPFKPSGDRPVYCKECFVKRKKSKPFNANRDNRSEDRDFPRKYHSDKQQGKKWQKPFKKKEPFYTRIK